MTVTERTYEQVALEDLAGQWELHRGVLREKPPMSAGHNYALRELDDLLHDQLDRTRFRISINASRVRRGDEVSSIPDLLVVPAAYVEAYRGRWEALEVFADPLPLVVEVWSPATGDYDVESKLPEYMARGDFEVWRLHPFERTLTAWRKRADGSYDETVITSGVVEPVALPGVRVDLDALFD